MVVLALAFAGVARAGVQVAGTGEPTYTKGTNNTGWFTYTSGGFDGYRVATTYGNDLSAGIFREVSGDVGPGTRTGTSWFNFQGVPGIGLPLAEGRSWGACVAGEDFYGYLGSWVPGLGGSSCSNGSIAGKSAFSIIDRSPPTLVVAVNGSAQFARSGPLNVSIAYSDAISPPWPNANAALGANATCIRAGGNPSTVCNGQAFTYDPACSTLAGPRARLTSFTCQLTIDGSVADGPVTLCARASDSAVPDNPASANQLVSATGTPWSSNDANVSGVSCGYVVLDRTAPALSIGGPASAIVGRPLALSAAGSDATSGLSGTWTWSFGDGTPPVGGAEASHTFSQAGTYDVTLTSTDVAGNTAQARRAVVVTSPSGPTDPGPGTPDPTPIPTSAPTPTTAPAPPATPAPGTPPSTPAPDVPGGPAGTDPVVPVAPTSAPGGGTVTPPPTAQQVAQAAGIPTTTRTRGSGSLEVLAPKRVGVGARKFSIAVTSDAPGKVGVTLARSGRTRAKGTVRLTGAGTIGFALKLPKGLPAGSYELRVTLEPAGGGKASVVKLKVQLAKPPAKRKVAAAATAGASDGVRDLGRPALPAPAADASRLLGRP